MKKLSLKNLKLQASDLIERNQLKNVFGGYSGQYTCNPVNGGYGTSTHSASGPVSSWGQLESYANAACPNGVASMWCFGCP